MPPEIPPEEPDPPGSLPEYLVEGVRRQNAATLRDLAGYARALAARHEAAAAEHLIAQRERAPDDAPDGWDDDEWAAAVEDARERAGIPGDEGALTRKTVDDREYYYLQWRDGDLIRNQYVAPVAPDGEIDGG